MKNKIFVLILALTLAVGMLASCQPECEHPLSENWSSDENGHWHPFTCEHGEKAKDASVPHVDPDEDGVCNVCEYKVGHDHTFGEEWVYSETHHWKTATCSHSDEKGEYSLHSDENADGSCDQCNVHVHGVNAAGYCTFTECGKKVVEIDESDFEILVYALAAQAKFANGGKMNYDFTGRTNNVGGDYATHSVKTVDYIFGKSGYSYYKTVTSTTGSVSSSSSLEGWYMPDGPETTFGIVSEGNGGGMHLDITDTDKLLGVYLALSGLADGYGPEAVLVSLYESFASDNTTNVDIQSYLDENKVVAKFSTYILNSSEIVVGENAGEMSYNLAHYDVELSFTYTDEYVLTSLDITVDCYTSDPGELEMGVPNELDIDLDYNPETDTYTFRENALADTYTVSFEQTIGERTAENPNPKSKFIPTGFELFLGYNEDTHVLSKKYNGENISVNVRDIVNIYFGNCVPEGTSIFIASDLVSFKLYKDGVEVENPEEYDNQTVVAMLTYTAGEQSELFVIPKEDGAYKLEIFYDGEKFYDVNILAGDVDEGNIVLKDNEFAVKVTETYEWANEVVFEAPKAGTYYFNLPAGIGFIDADGFDAAEKTPATDDSPDPYFDYNNAKNKDGSYNPGSFSLTLEEGQEVRFYVNSINRGTFVISYVVI